MLASAILILGFVSRVFVHVPNFTPVIALALLGGATLNRKTAMVLPVAILALTDLVLGLHPTMPFTWGSVALIAALGSWLRGRQNIKNVTLFSIASAVVFFIITNFGCWLFMYPRNGAGFEACFIAALPFFRSMLASTLIYSAVFFGGYEVAAARIRKTRWAKVLISI